MAIQLTYLGFGDEEEVVLVPVAASQTFADYWAPAAEALGLVLVPLFQTGMAVTRARLNELESELRRLRDHWLEESFEDPALGRHLVERVSSLIEHLSKIPDIENRDAYIG